MQFILTVEICQEKNLGSAKKKIFLTIYKYKYLKILMKFSSERAHYILQKSPPSALKSLAATPLF